MTEACEYESMWVVKGGCDCGLCHEEPERVLECVDCLKRWRDDGTPQFQAAWELSL